ncbi:MAG: glycoside hydrolase family 99-like domain-containing protein [Planctomycetota bacterium]
MVGTRARARTRRTPSWTRATRSWRRSPETPPERFRQALEIERARLEKRPARERVPTVNSWNEWTEGSYLEPDAHLGTAYLEALREVFDRKPRVSIRGGRWHLDGRVTYPGTRAEGLLMNARMVNAVFEDARRPDFDARANAEAFVRKIPDYVAAGVRAFTISPQGGMPGYEGALNSAFEPDGSLKPSYLERVQRAIEASDAAGAAIILSCYYQRQDQVLRDAEAVRAGVRNAVRWLREERFPNVLLEIANEFPHGGFDHEILRSPAKQAELLRLARREWAELLVSTSGLGDGRLPDEVCEESDFLLIHLNGVPLEEIPSRIAALRKWGKPIVVNEDDKAGAAGARAAEACVAGGASWGCMLKERNQYFPFRFEGAADDPEIYAKLRELTSR